MQIMALQFSAAVLIVSAIGLIQSNASITYVDIIDESKLGKFVNLTESDFSSNITEVDTKPIIMTHLAGSGSQLTSDVMNFLGNPLQGSGKLEGDIELPPGSKLLHSDTNYTTLAYSAIVDRRLFWVDAVIPYTISEAYGRYSRAQIAKAIIEIKRSTCLKLIPWSNQDDYIAIRPALGCSSHVGRMGGKQVVSISAGCTQKVTIIHELMHAAGFYHEQARHDRDEYVVIHWQNIDPIPEIKAQFEKRDISTVTVLGMPYDQRSIMHYRSTAFAKSPGLVTITALNGGEVSNDDGMTQLDIAKLNKLYQCNENDAEVTTGSSTTTATTTTTTISKLTTKSVSERCPSNGIIAQL